VTYDTSGPGFWLVDEYFPGISACRRNHAMSGPTWWRNKSCTCGCTARP
jgi:hypothetical protein